MRFFFTEKLYLKSLDLTDRPSKAQLKNRIRAAINNVPDGIMERAERNSTDVDQTNDMIL